MAGNLEPGPLQGVLVEVQRRSALVAADGGGDFHCQYSPIIDLAAFSNFAVGDRVAFVPTTAGQESMITAILPRRNRISRPGPMDRRDDELILAANVDALMVVATPRHPDYNPRLVDRYLVLAAHFGIDALLCLNKIDLDPVFPPEAEYLRGLGYPVIACSAKTGEGLDRMRAALGGKTAVLSGSSGVGKSSLIRALFPGSDPRVGEVRKGEGKGRHTTTTSHMYRGGPAGSGISIIDTPGIRELGLRVTRKELGGLWRDIASLAGSCRFRDCVHAGEPGCAVAEAAQGGAFPAHRLDSYLRMLETLEK